jgi:glycolate oxidase
LNTLQLVQQTLETALPEGRVVLFSGDEHSAYTKDYSSSSPVAPSLIVEAQSQKDVQIVLEVANQYNVPVTPRGTGTGKSGGSIPLPGGIVLGLQSMNRILEIDVANKMVVVEPGVITKTLQDELEKVGLFYPPDPSSYKICTIGGNVIENAGGPKALKYGVTSEYVVGLKGVWADGRPFDYGGKLYKNVAGYNFIQLLVGSEGTLGVITEITLRVRLHPKVQTDILAAFNTVEDASKALLSIQEARIQPVLAELMDKTCVKAVESFLGTSIPNSDAGAHVIFQVDGNDKAQTDAEAMVLSKLCQKHGAVHVALATSEDEKEAIWNTRRNVSEALTAFSEHKESVDISVPPSKIGEYLDHIASLNTSDKHCVLGYGHLGDGNIHVNILNLKHTENEWGALFPGLEKSVFEKAVQLGGTITGEHGIGLSKRPYLNLMFSDEDRNYMKAVKAVFDPKNILNSDKAI